MDASVPNIARFRRKTFDVEMIRFDGDNGEAVAEWAGSDEQGRLAIPGPEGEVAIFNSQEGAWLSVPAGHYVARGRLGELYPISPDALEGSYEKLAA